MAFRFASHLSPFDRYGIGACRRIRYVVLLHEEFTYLRNQLRLSKTACVQNILTLQETYDMYLPDGEDKSIFDIDSAAYIQTIMEAIHNRKVYKKIRAIHKSELGTYQMFLTQNKHKIIAECDS